MDTVTGAAPAAAGKRPDIVELDVLRGVAAVLMIVNHAGYRLLSAADAVGGLSGLAVFLGSFAPVLFFFATGFGIGLGVAATQQAPALGSTLWKAALLLLADQIGYWAVGEAGGLNFFGFIGIAMMTLALVARVRRSTALALGLVVVLLIGRYALGPVLREPSGAWHWFDPLLGARGVTAVAYPLSPWMVYPLVGFVLGKVYRTSSLRRWLRAGVLVGLAAGAAAALLIEMNSGLLRWGTVSAAFFVLSFAVLAAAAMVSMAMAMRTPRAASALALRGVASFAVIPLHYALLDTSGALALPLSPALFALAAAAIAVVSWLGANRVAALVGDPAMSRHRSTAVLLLLGTLGMLMAIGLLAATGPLAPVVFLIAQLLIAALLGLRTRPEAGRIVTPARV